MTNDKCPSSNDGRPANHHWSLELGHSLDIGHWSLVIHLTASMITSDLPAALRSFIAIELPQEIRDGLRAMREQLQTEFPKESLRWVPLEQIHLTLVFLGEIPSDSLREMEPVLEKICGACAPLRLRLEGLGCFPNPARPRVVWL